MPLALSYSTGLVMKGSVDDKTRLLTIARAEYIFLGGVKFATNAEDRACASYPTDSLQFDHIGGSLKFCVPVINLDALKYFG